MMDMLNGDWAIFDRKVAHFGSTWGIALKSALKDLGFLPGDTVTIAILKPGKKLVIHYDYEVIDEDTEKEEE